MADSKSDYNGTFNTGGDELDTLLSNQSKAPPSASRVGGGAVNLSRQSRHSNHFQGTGPVTPISESRLEEEYKNRLSNDCELMTKEYDSIFTSRDLSTATAQKQVIFLKFLNT